MDTVWTSSLAKSFHGRFRGQGLRGESVDSFATFPRPSWESQDRWPLSCSESGLKKNFAGFRGDSPSETVRIHKAWVKKWPIFFIRSQQQERKSHIYKLLFYISNLVVRHGSWSNEPWMEEKHMKWNCEVKQRKLAKERLKTTWLQCKVSHLFYEFYCQTICIGKISAKFPTENICVFGRWRSFMYIDFENLRFYTHLSKKIRLETILFWWQTKKQMRHFSLLH